MRVNGIRLAILFLAALPLAAQTAVSALPARRTPEFLASATVYQIWMRTFTREGTLQAAARRMPHIARLGAKLVYLSPVNLQSQVGGFSNPYRIKDYYAIDPEYGSEADLKALVASAHRHGLKLMMDVVFYHTAPDSVMMQHPDYYMHDAAGAVLLGNWKLPRPDFDNPALRRYLIDSLAHWVKTAGVDGFRCDVSAGIPLDFWEQARGELDKLNPELILLAESDLPAEQVKAFDISYNFGHYDALAAAMRDGAPASRVRENWEKKHAAFPAGARFLHLSDNHDRDRAVVVFGDKGSLAAAVLNFTLDGIPFLYNGQEVADATPTDHQAHVPIRWEIDDASGRPNSVRGAQLRRIEFYQKLFALRGREPAIHRGDLAWVENNRPDSVLSFVRRRGADQILVVVNLSNRIATGSAEFSAPPSMLERLMAASNASVSPGANGVEFQLPAYGYVVAKGRPAGSR